MTYMVSNNSDHTAINNITKPENKVACHNIQEVFEHISNKILADPSLRISQFVIWSYNKKMRQSFYLCGAEEFSTKHQNFAKKYFPNG